MLIFFCQFREPAPQRFRIGYFIEFAAEAMQFVRVAYRFDFGTELNAGKTFASEQAQGIGFPQQGGLPFFFATFFAAFFAPFI